MSDIDIPSDVKLVLVPDAGSNDYLVHKKLKENGVDIIVLDHHEAEYVSPDAIIINNQLSDYQNKELSGVGVVYQFCRYLHDLVPNSPSPDKYLDLVSLGLVADMMDFRSIETKHLIQKGLENVRNPFIKGMSKKNAYSMKNKITPTGLAFYIAPYVNAITRSGTIEEKQIIFQSMLDYMALKKVPSTKRGHKLGEEETIIDQALRVATNVKNRQAKAQTAGMTILEKQIQENDLLNHKVIVFCLEPGSIDRNILGLCANKIMAKYNKPCCTLVKGEEDYSGSARGCEKTGINTFKDICEETGETTLAQGHQSAFGLSVPKGKINAFLEKTDEILKDVNDKAIYKVDFVLHSYDDNLPNLITEISKLDYLWGKSLEEPLVAIKGVKVTNRMVSLMKEKVLKIALGNGVELIDFSSNEDKYLELLSDEGYKEIDLVGVCGINEWNGKITPQIKIKDYEIVDGSEYFF